MDVLTKEQRSKLMAKVRRKHTKPEIIVRRTLHRLGMRFRLHRSDLPGTPDIVLPSRSLAIYVHGCFWHGHSCRAGRLPTTNHDLWVEKRRANLERDARKARELQAKGWQVVIVWECETKVIASLEERLRAISTLGL